MVLKMYNPILKAVISLGFVLCKQDSWVTKLQMWEKKKKKTKQTESKHPTRFSAGAFLKVTFCPA